MLVCSIGKKGIDPDGHSGGLWAGGWTRVLWFEGLALRCNAGVSLIRDSFLKY